ncbi:MAG TPA: acyl-CoA dehydrogenase family protein, partial [Polyangiaceae bacterium]|nr:acyl-CoA dehydrogenase family protein [Polyangiaceae bacterium]
MHEPTKQSTEHLDAVRQIALELAGPAADAVDRDARFPHEAVEGLKKARMMSAFVPTSLGGLGIGMGELAAMC